MKTVHCLFTRTRPKRVVGVLLPYTGEVYIGMYGQPKIGSIHEKQIFHVEPGSARGSTDEGMSILCYKLIAPVSVSVVKELVASRGKNELLNPGLTWMLVHGD